MKKLLLTLMSVILFAGAYAQSYYPAYTPTVGALVYPKNYAAYGDLSQPTQYSEYPPYDTYFGFCNKQCDVKSFSTTKDANGNYIAILHCTDTRYPGLHFFIDWPWKFVPPTNLTQVYYWLSPNYWPN